MDVRCRLAIWLSNWFPEALHLHDASYIPVRETAERRFGGYYRCRRANCRATRFMLP